MYLTGLPLTDDQLHEAAVMSEVLQVEEDYMPLDFRKKCEECVPDPQNLEPKECSAMFIKLKKYVK